jgi:hypothetical protein
LLRSLGKRMPEAETRKQLEALHLNVQAAVQLQSSDATSDLCE